MRKSAGHERSWRGKGSAENHVNSMLMIKILKTKI